MVIDNLVVVRPTKPIMVSCTYCWQQHAAHQDGDKLIVTTTTCGKDPRRYFLNHSDYIAYVRRYEAEGDKHIDEWDNPQIELPLFAVR